MGKSKEHVHPNTTQKSENTKVVAAAAVTTFLASRLFFFFWAAAPPDIGLHNRRHAHEYPHTFVCAFHIFTRVPPRLLFKFFLRHLNSFESQLSV